MSFISKSEFFRHRYRFASGVATLFNGLSLKVDTQDEVIATGSKIELCSTPVFDSISVRNSQGSYDGVVTFCTKVGLPDFMKDNGLCIDPALMDLSCDFLIHCNRR